MIRKIPIERVEVRFGIIIFLVLYAQLAWFNGVKLLGAEFVDLPSFFAAAKATTQGLSAYAFSPAAIVPEATTRVFPFLYPPPSLLPFTPLAGLDYRTAGAAMVAVNHLALLGCVGLLVRRFGPVLPTFVLLTASGVTTTITHGQINLITLCALLAAWEFCDRERPIAGGVALGLAILLKTYPVILLPLLLLVGQRRAVISAVATFALCAALALFIVPWAAWRDWIFVVAPTGGYMSSPLGLFPPDSGWNQSLNGFFARQLLATAPDLGRVLTTISAVLVFLVTAWRVRSLRTTESVMLLGLPAMFLMAPLSWDHHTVFLLPSLIALASSSVALVFGASCVLAIVLLPAVTLSLKFYAAAALLAVHLIAVKGPNVRLDLEAGVGPFAQPESFTTSR